MHFAWKDDNFLIKILTTIMVFIVVIMIAISPAFAVDLSDYDVVFPEGEEDTPYYFISSFLLYAHGNYWTRNSICFSDSPFIFDFHRKFLVNGKYEYLADVYYVSSSTGFRRYYTFEGNGGYPSYYSFDFSNSTLQTVDAGSLLSVYVPLESYSSDVDVISSLFYTNAPITSSDGEEIFTPPVQFENPSFITTDEELATGNFQTLKIDAGDYDSSDSEDINLGIFDITGREFGLSTITDLPNLMVYNTKLNFSSRYLVGEDGGVFYYIPQSDLGIDLSNGKQYYFVLANDEGERFDQSIFTVGGLTAEEELKNKQDETNQKLDEANETNKGIWETIKEVLSYINPFSENFFVYKLIDLLIDAIKTLFIPSDDFFSTYFTNLQDWFSDRLGFLFYPFELIIDILNDILNIDFSEPQFNIPDINEPFTGKKLISATTFNFNDLLDNSVWNTVHNIYLILVDAAIVFGLVNLFHKKYEEVTTK